MLLWFIMPVIIGGWGNILVPFSLTKSDFDFPRLNLASVTVFGLSMILFIGSLHGNGAGKSQLGWTMYPPLSSTNRYSIVSYNIEVLIIALLVNGTASMIASINFITSILCGRAKENDPNKGMQVFTVSIGAVSGLLIVVVPVLGGALMMIISDRMAGSCFFTGKGGDPMLYIHLFWFFGHPEVYIIILPCFGLISSILNDIANQSKANNKVLIMSIVSISALSFFVYGHHMFTTPLEIETHTFFSILTLVIGIPTGVKIYSWSAMISQLPKGCAYFEKKLVI